MPCSPSLLPPQSVPFCSLFFSLLVPISGCPASSGLALGVSRTERGLQVLSPEKVQA